MAKKRKGKYPNLDHSQNTKSRGDYIEVDYINGVKDKNGREVIRSLTEQEKAWLNKFYGEAVAMSDRQLNPTPEIMDYMKKKSEYKKSIAKIRKEQKVKTNKQIEYLQSRVVEVEQALDFLREEQGVFHTTCEEQRKLYSTNNTRNFCVYNNRKARGMLIELTTESFDSLVAQHWDSLATFDYDSQDALIEIVEERLRQEGFLGDLRENEKFSNSSDDTDD